MKEVREIKTKLGYGCPIETLMVMIGGKWKTVILHFLSIETRRTGELRRLIPNISQRILTQNLRELEADGVIHREIYDEVPPRVEYSLTPLGRSLEPLINSMNTWAMIYIPDSIPDISE